MAIGWIQVLQLSPLSWWETRWRRGWWSGILVIIVKYRGDYECCQVQDGELWGVQIMLSSVRIKEVTGGSHLKRFSVTTSLLYPKEINKKPKINPSSSSLFLLPFPFLYIPSTLFSRLSPNLLGPFSLFSLKPNIFWFLIHRL